MFNMTIFKQTARESFRLWLICTLILLSLVIVFVYALEPTLFDQLAEALKDIPFANMYENTTFLSMLANSFYIMHGLIIPLIFILVTANSIVALQVDRGSMAYLLSTPLSRGVIIRTKALYLVISSFLIIALTSITGYLAIIIFERNDNYFSLSNYWHLNIGLFLLLFALGAIAFFFSCFFNTSKNSLALGTGIPLYFFIMSIISTTSEKLENLQYATINSFFAPEKIALGNINYTFFLILLAIGFLFYYLATRLFENKDLPL